MRRSIPSLGLLFMSLSAIIGSGWLFSAYYASKLAGPASLISWLIGGLCAIVIAFVFAELCAMLPVSGSSTRIPQYTHGTTVSFTFSWIIWLAYLALMTTETQAVIQYCSFYFPSLTQTSGALTFHGYLAAAVLLFIISAINTYSLHWLIRANNILTAMKLAIPIIVVVVLLIVTLPTHSILNPSHHAFSPQGIHGVFTALVGGGIIFAFTGFKLAAELAGEAKNPARGVPIAIIGSVLISLILFVALQVAFLSSLEPANLIGGWAQMKLSSNLSPFAAIFEQEKVHWLLPILYIGAVIAPMASGLMYCSSASRSMYGMSKNGHIPKFFKKLSVHHHPFNAIIFNYFVGLLLFAPLPGWSAMVSFLTSLLAMSYIIGPICLISLRLQVPSQNRPLRLPLGILWSYIAFFICTMLTYWSGWHIVSKMFIALFIGYAIFFAYHGFSRRKIEFNLSATIWLWPYMLGLLILSYSGNYGGGHHLLSTVAEWLIIAVFCAIILLIAILCRMPTTHALSYISKLSIYEQNPTEPSD